MHELSVCQALMDQVEAVAAERGARRVTAIWLRIGPLAGVEAALLRAAFPIASAGTLAEGSRLEIEEAPLRVRCTECGAVTAALPNRLLCAACGCWRTQLESGDELLLASLELET